MSPTSAVDVLPAAVVVRGGTVTIAGSLLGIDAKRRLAVVAVLLVIMLAGGVFVAYTGGGELVAMPMAFALWVPFFLMLDRPAVIERHGFRCRHCGYDLQGQAVPRCPECGREFDAAERARMEAGTSSAAPRAASRPRRLIALILIFIALLVTFGLGLAVYHTSRMAPAPPPVPTTEP